MHKNSKYNFLVCLRNARKLSNDTQLLQTMIACIFSNASYHFFQSYHSVKPTKSSKAIDTSYAKVAWDWQQRWLHLAYHLYSSTLFSAHPFSVNHSIKAAGDPQSLLSWQCHGYSYVLSIIESPHMTLVFLSAVFSLGCCCWFSIRLASTVKNRDRILVYGLAFTHRIDPPPKYDFSFKRISFWEEIRCSRICK